MRLNVLREVREEVALEKSERQRLIDDVREAEREWRLAEWRFQDALGSDHVDYAIYCLEAAERKLDMLLRQAKWYWDHSKLPEGSVGRE
ncbi:DUF2508 domain-containing protein [Cohnella yongneupensis]|uniref:DUF2508 domain-containing protein n=1 Tax=Cohnella yongneupensis TaxID=425006 RepID=A0ABW0QZQ9_9BACL